MQGSLQLVMKINEVVSLLKKGKIGIFPTDTAFGIGCRCDDKDSVENIYRIRNRPEDKALLILVDSLEMAEKYSYINNEVKKTLVGRYWPGALTLILPCKKEKVIKNVRAGGDTIAIRLPDHKVLREIIKGVGVPIVAPSANFSGEATPYSLSDVDTNLIDKVDFVLEGVCTMKGVSTIIDTTSNPYTVIRQGVINIEK